MPPAHQGGIPHRALHENRPRPYLSALKTEAMSRPLRLRISETNMRKITSMNSPSGMITLPSIKLGKRSRLGITKVGTSRREHCRCESYARWTMLMSSASFPLLRMFKRFAVQVSQRGYCYHRRSGPHNCDQSLKVTCPTLDMRSTKAVSTTDLIEVLALSRTYPLRTCERVSRWTNLGRRRYELRERSGTPLSGYLGIGE